MMWALAIHGGAGIIKRGDALEKDYRIGLERALAIGGEILQNGGSAIDAVTQSVIELENNPIFNAGRGSVLTSQQEFELDSAIMDGKNQEYGAVAGLNTFKNPILIAKALLQKQKRLFLIGQGAREFALSNGFEEVDKNYFLTPLRQKQFENWLAKNFDETNGSHKKSTVGAVALDNSGNLAAATSTGGLTGKIKGRVGDCPLIGAGTIAINDYAAISCTGTGEYFIATSAARQIVERMRFGKESLEKACENTILEIGALGGDGAIIGLDKNGSPVFAINDLGAYRGYYNSDGKIEIGIFGDETPKTIGKIAKTSKHLH